MLNVSGGLQGVEIEPKQCQICRSRREDSGAVLNVSGGLQGVEIEAQQCPDSKKTYLRHHSGFLFPDPLLKKKRRRGVTKPTSHHPPMKNGGGARFTVTTPL